MAANIKDDDERKNRMFKVYNYFMQTNESTRNIAEYFSKNEFCISNATVSAYLKNILEYLNEKDKIALIEALNDRKTKSIDDTIIINRVIKVSNLCLNGYSIDQIKDEINVSYWTVYRDLVLRLPKLDKEKALIVKEKLKENSLSNLIK